MKNDVRSILLAGVGGQGILRASDILCQVMMDAGYDTKKSEVHGMAQRGGCVTSHVQYGKKVHSPIARKADVDILVSFEKMETLRYLDYLKPDGIVIINNEEINPPAVNQGDFSYPQNIVEIIKNSFNAVRLINANDLASKAGNAKAANTVLLGTLSCYLKFNDEIWENALRKSFPEKLVEINISAFNVGKVS